MGAFTVYAIEVAVIMSVLYLGYKWLLSSSTFHSFNRIILIAIYAVSLVLPIFMPFFNFSHEDAVMTMDIPMVSVMPETEISEAPMQDADRHMIQWGLLAEAIYALGICVAFAVSIVSVEKMARMFYSGTKMEGYPDVIVSDSAPGPFSWGNVIMIRPSDIDSDLEYVVAHERAHLSRFHWVDLILGHIVIAFQWFSPASYLMLREMRIVHEYEVDEEMSRTNPYSYQMMLIKKAAGSSFPTFADSLNSQLKLRITMMLSKKSRGSRRYASLALIPMAAIAVVGLSQPSVASVLSEITESDVRAEVSSLTQFVAPSVNKGEVSKTPTDLQEPESTVGHSEAAPALETTIAAVENEAVEEISAVENKNDDKDDEVYVAVEEMADFPGGQSALLKFIRDNTKIPEGFTGKTRVIIRFQINKDGSLSDFKIIKSGGEECDKEALRVMKICPKWIPGKVRGKPVASLFALPLTFDATDGKETTQSEPVKKTMEERNVSEDDVHQSVQELAEYPGGKSALIQFLDDNVKTPEGITEKKFVVVRLVIEKDGSISQTTILKGVDKELDKEALRVVKEMPKWIPGKNNGEPVRSTFVIPITFGGK